MNKLSYLLVISILVFSCKPESSNSLPPKLTKADTSFCVGIYKKDTSVNGIRFDQMRRVVRDMRMLDPKDSMRLVWTKDTFYLIVIRTQIDSILSKQYNMPMKDSLGKPTIAPLEYVYDKRYVRSGWDNADSAQAQLQRIK